MIKPLGASSEIGEGGADPVYLCPQGVLGDTAPRSSGEFRFN